jgi:pimeloyl-ACP methyl ester carboxylesterase
MRAARIDLGGRFAGLRLGYTEWGDPSTPERPVVCVHGLTRNARDFDHLAETLSLDRRVICIDVAGRGLSDWLADPVQYDVPVYADHIEALLGRLGIAEVDWIGTSMGGLIAMALASRETSPIRRLILNDIGPFVPKAALAPIAAYLGLDLRFPSLAELEKHLRLIHASFGPLTDAQWRHLTLNSARADGDAWRLHYDPAIKVPFQALAPQDIDGWEQWQRIACPVLAIRGGASLLLTPDVAQAMTERGPKAELITLDGIGHAPALMDGGQIELIRMWLQQAS